MATTDAKPVVVDLELRCANIRRRGLQRFDTL